MKFFSLFLLASSLFFNASADKNTININDMSAFIQVFADIEAVDKNGKRPLERALQHNRNDIAQMLIKQGAQVDSYYSTYMPLEIAIRNNSLEQVQMLLHARANVNKRNEYKQTPLLLAVQMGHLDIVKRLLSAGADVDAGKPDEWEKGCEYTPLIAAVANGNVEIVTVLIQAKANLNKTCIAKKCMPSMSYKTSGYDSHPLTPLMVASLKGNKQIAKLLIDAGANVNFRSEGKSYNTRHDALTYTAFTLNEDMARFLIDSGADISYAHKEGVKSVRYHSEKYAQMLEKIINEKQTKKN